MRVFASNVASVGGRRGLLWLKRHSILEQVQHLVDAGSILPDEVIKGFPRDSPLVLRLYVKQQLLEFPLLLLIYIWLH